MMTMRLREIAEAKGLYLNKIHLDTGIDLGVLRRYWKGDTRSYERNISSQLKNYFGVGYDELFGDETTTTTAPTQQ